MLADVKQQMINDPERLAELLEYFGYTHIQIGRTEIRFARNEAGDRNIRICLHDNPYINVQDFARDIYHDLIAYIMQERGLTFSEVLQGIKTVFKIENLSNFRKAKKREIFGGIYSSVHKKDEPEIEVYSDSIMDRYEHIPSIRFLKDHISLEIQKQFGVAYDHESSRIVFPIRNEYGEIVGVKGRWNGEEREDQPKYLYLLRVPSGKVLYGYSENYMNLTGNEVLICEAEKATMQAAAYGYRNCVSLGGHNLSETHAKLIYQLNPKRIIIAMDEGLDPAYTMRNATTLKAFCRMQNPEIWTWDATKSNVKSKSSLTDHGQRKFYEIMKNDLIKID